MDKNSRTFDYLVIGAGSGGLLVAIGLLKLGKSVGLVSENIGGDCTNFGCVPSKALLHLANTYQQEKNSSNKIAIFDSALDTVRRTITSFSKEESEIIPRDIFFEGTAKFVDKNKISVKLSKSIINISFKKRCIIATGGHPKTINIEGLPNKYIITNEDLFYLKRLPKSISIIGAGPIGAEIATACAKFGIKTNLISPAYLPKEPNQLSEVSLKMLVKLGVNYYNSSPLRFKGGYLELNNNVKVKQTEYYLEALGRLPNTDLNLERAQIEFDNFGIKANSNLITSNPKIFAIGDCINGPKFTHVAANHGKFVLKKIMIPFVQRKIRSVPRVTFLDHPIASVGIINQSKYSKIFDLNFTSLDRARVNFDTQSKGVIAIDPRNGQILGASLLGKFSEELINTIALMMDEKIGILSLTDFITPYPTYGNIFHSLSKDYLTYLSKNWRQYPIGSFMQIVRYIFK